MHSLAALLELDLGASLSALLSPGCMAPLGMCSLHFAVHKAVQLLS